MRRAKYSGNPRTVTKQGMEPTPSWYGGPGKLLYRNNPMAEALRNRLKARPKRVQRGSNND